MKPRHIFGSLMLAAESPILAVLVVGWLISGAVYATGRAVSQARSRVSTWRGGRILTSALHRPRHANSGSLQEV